MLSVSARESSPQLSASCLTVRASVLRIHQIRSTWPMAIPLKCTKNKSEGAEWIALDAEIASPHVTEMRQVWTWGGPMDIRGWMDRIVMVSHGGQGDGVSVLLFFTHEVNEFIKSHSVSF